MPRQGAYMDLMADLNCTGHAGIFFVGMQTQRESPDPWEKSESIYLSYLYPKSGCL